MSGGENSNFPDHDWYAKLAGIMLSAIPNNHVTMCCYYIIRERRRVTASEPYSPGRAGIP